MHSSAAMGGMSVGSKASSDTDRLIDALRTLDTTLRTRGQSPAKTDRVLSRKMSSFTLGSTGGTGVDGDMSKEDKRDDKVQVEVRVVFLKIGEIDTQKEKYSADVFLQAKWREPRLDGITDKIAEDVDWTTEWTPKLYIDNVMGECKESVWYMLVFDEICQCTVYEKHRYSGAFLETLELNRFPFDTQDLTITVTSERSEDELSIIEDEQELCGVNVQSFKDEQEWRLHRHVETWCKVTTKVFQNAKFKHPALSVACKTSRRPGFFVWNIFFVMFFIASLAFSTFSVEISLPQNRLQLSFILLLTTVTFKFIVNQNLPRISYLTYLDKYILITMSILCIVCMWHSLATIVISRTDKETAESVDKIVLIILGSVFIAFHGVFIMWVLIINKVTSKNLGQKEAEHENRQKVLETITEGGSPKIKQDSPTDPDCTPRVDKFISPLSDHHTDSRTTNGLRHSSKVKPSANIGVIMEDV